MSSCSGDNPCCMPLIVGVKLMALGDIVIQVAAMTSYILPMLATSTDGTIVIVFAFFLIFAILQLLSSFVLSFAGGCCVKVDPKVKNTDEVYRRQADADACRLCLWLTTNFLIWPILLIKFIVDLCTRGYETYLFIFIMEVIIVFLKPYMVYCVWVLRSGIRGRGNGKRYNYEDGQVLSKPGETKPGQAPAPVYQPVVVQPYPTSRFLFGRPYGYGYGYGYGYDPYDDYHYHHHHPHFGISW